MIVYLNEKYVSRGDAVISVDDRGFLFGDGIYEVLRCINGKPFRLESHLRRMNRGLNALGICLPESQRGNIPEIIHSLIERNQLQNQDTTVYLQITRGSYHPRTHAWPPEQTSPSVFITAAPFQPNSSLQESGAYAITAPDVRWSRCDLKTVNLLPNVMLAQQAKDNKVFGTLMVRDGVITEGYNNNIFAVFNDTLHTHPDSPYILPGITREVVFEIAEKAGTPVALSPVRESDLYHAGEVLLTGTTTDIQPVIRINGHPVGNGKPGPIVRLLQKELKDLMFL